VNEPYSAGHLQAVGRLLGPSGRVVSYVDTEYTRVRSERAVLFNASVCIAGRSVWWGDIDLTESEIELVRLAADTDETVSLVEDDNRHGVDNVRSDRAAYSVTPSGHTQLRASIYVRGADGRIYLRAPEHGRRLIRPSWPRIWPFWRIDVRWTRWAGARGDDGYSTVAVIFGGRPSDGSPHLILTCAWFTNVARGGWLEWSWFPSATQRRWAPPIRYTARRIVGRIRPWGSIDLAAGECDEVRVGVVVGASDPRWG
jgi:hypothetical protein